MMKNWIFTVLLVTSLMGCTEKKNHLSEGLWIGELQVMDHETLPFNFNLTKKGKQYTAEIYNGTEKIKVSKINISNESITLHIPVFEAYLKGVFTEENISGIFVNETLNRILPFKATYGKTDRFSSTTKAKELISGIWETNFNPNSPDEYAAKGIFVQNNDKVTGTFRTTTGDYRFLEGIVTGDSLKLSAFDGSHAFLFLAKIKDTVLEGVFYSGSHGKEYFIGKRNKAFELPDEDLLTSLKEGFDTFDFYFPDKTGKLISLSDKQFDDKPIIVQIMGTWCTNSLDETRFLVDFIDKHKEINVSVVSLAFEFVKTEERAFKSIQKLKDEVGIPYPVLLAQFGTPDKQKAQEKLPMLNHVLSYPTIVFIDKKRAVRKIITGFNGPATGTKFLQFKEEFTLFITELANE